MSRAKHFSVLPIGGLSLLTALSACGRTDLQEDSEETTVASGGVVGAGGNAASGFTSMGGRATGGNASTGGRSSGGALSTGGRATGGNASTGGRSTGGTTSTGGRYTGGTLSTGGRATGVMTSTGGRYAGGTASTGGSSAGATTSTVVQPTGGTSHTGGAASGGQPGTAINTGGAGTGGTAGSSGAAQWYVDAQNGSDDSPGTQALPFKTLNRAATAALAGDTVNLLDGIWDSSIDVKLASTATTDCGLSSGIAFAPNVTLRAGNPGNARVVGAGYHGLCMSGGLIDGLRLDCGQSGQPIFETRQGTLTMVATSLSNCGVFGIDVAGTAAVSVKPGNLTDYSEVPNSSFAIAREQSSLTIEGGTLSFMSLATQAQDSANLIIHAVTFTSQDAASMAGIAVTLAGSSPKITLDGGTSMDNIAIGVEGNNVSSDVSIDGMKFTNGNLAVMINQATGTNAPNVAINGLVVADTNGPGIDLTGPCNLSVTNSTFSGCSSPAILLNISGSLTLDTVAISEGWGGLILTGDESGNPLSAIVRNVSVTGGQYSGVVFTTDPQDSFDFGTALSPGNNVFRGNNAAADSASANLVFTISNGIVVPAVGNTWDANQQGSDANGWYHVTAAGVPFDVISGTGPNYLSDSGSAGTLRLAE